LKKIHCFLFPVVLILTHCTSFPEQKEAFRTKTSPEVQKGLESFIESYNWNARETAKRPVIAATPEEIARLKSAWAGADARHTLLAQRFSEVDKALDTTLTFPPEGGQHNQWYQCGICQRGLVTVDPNHHKCPQCGRVYSGFPYDNVIYSHIHSNNFSMAEDAAWAWAVTGEKKYAEFAAGILRGYSERYNNYPMVDAGVNDRNIDVAAQKNDKYSSAGHIMAQTLDESMIMIPAVVAFDLIYNSNALSKEDKKQIEGNLIRSMADCINVNKTGKSNWQTWHNAALMYAGIVLGDKQMVKQAVLDDENGFTAQMKISVLPEGMWYENSWGYHYYTLHAMTLIAEGGRRLGMDFYSDETLRKMYLLAFDYLMADGSLPRFGDAVKDSPNDPLVNEPAYAVYMDERLLATLPEGPTWEMIISGRKPGMKAEQPQPGSKLIPGSGHAILATDGPGKLTAAISFGPYGGFHGHFDKLSFVFFGFKQELAVDPGRAASQAYRLPIHSDWYKATTGHNAILVDGQPQQEAEGRLLSFAATPSYAAVSADAGPAFGNISQRRFLLLGPTYLLVVDELRAKDGKEHLYDWLYHNKGMNASCSLPANNTSPGEMPPGYSYLRDIKSFVADKEEQFDVTFPSDGITTRLTMLGEKGDEVFTATGPLASIVDRVPATIVRRKGNIVHFITVIEPVAQQTNADVRGLSLIPGSKLSVSILRADGEDRISFEGESLENFSVTGNHGSSGQSILLSSTSYQK
jgi:oligo-alginate lyase